MSNHGQFRVFLARPEPPEHFCRLQHFDVTVYDKSDSISYNELKKQVVGAHALLIDYLETIDKELLDAAGPQLKVISTQSVGLDHIDLQECKRRGIKVGFVPDVMNTAVAELAVALALMTARKLQQALRSAHSGVWVGSNNIDSNDRIGRQVSGSVIGIVGLGRIGFATAKLFSSFGASKIVYCGRTAKPCATDINAEFVSFRDLLSLSDFVVIACSLNSSTEHLFNAEAFGQMKPSSILINVGRGGVVDQDALYNALTTKQIAGAGLDVTTPEPLSADHKLQSVPNCVITPHIASSTVEAIDGIRKLAIDNILAGLKGEPLPSSAY